MRVGSGRGVAGLLLVGLVLGLCGAAHAGIYGTAILADNPVVYYDFDDAVGTLAISNLGTAGAAYNTSMVNSGTETWQVSAASAVMGTALDLGAASGTGGGTTNGAHFVIPGNSTHYATYLSAPNTSLEFWINTTQTDGASNGWNNPALMGEDNSTGCCGGGGGDSWWGMMETTGAAADKGKIGYNDNSNAPVDVRTATQINDGAWHYIAITRDQPGNKMSVYLDGALSASTNQAAPTRNFNALGRGSRNQDSHLDAQIDEVAIYNYTLTAQDVEDHWVAAGFAPPPPPPPPPPAVLLHHWKLDGMPGGQALDDVGPNDGAVSGNVSLVAGKFGQAFDFAGTNDYVDFGDEVNDMETPGKFSVAMWFNRRTGTTGGGNDTNHGVNNVLIGQSSNSDNDNFELGTEANQVELYLDTGGGSADTTVRATVPGGIADGEWHHIAVTYDQSSPDELKLFFNGDFIQQWSQFGGSLDQAGGTDGSPLTLAVARSIGEKWGDFDGLIDDVRIYDAALTDDEVAELFAGPTGEIPEPATMALLGLACAGLGGYVRRRRNAKTAR